MLSFTNASDDSSARGTVRRQKQRFPFTLTSEPDNGSSKRKYRTVGGGADRTGISFWKNSGRAGSLAL
ncbi:hypothetical protein COCON_G00004000 [Conger conger]|uniref:Uncharacterized protein n=1 Tax=Conger conger TaxID=82655 RepID=A0A9Q1E165_CONCO|nr:hypothetical protein COCON_G00004000 [Conger conger]